MIALGKDKLAIEATLVNINHTATCKLRVLNHFSSDTCLRQDAIKGTAEKIEIVINTITKKEHGDEEDNSYSGMYSYAVIIQKSS